ncbi:MAG: hypothetical protein ACXABG_12385, partial [Promethearchaeota archaeon]
MPEIKIFVDVSESTTDKVVICQENADKLGIKNGASIEVHNPDNDKQVTAEIEISNMVLDFAGQVSKNIVDSLDFMGVELILRPVSAAALLTPTLKVPKVPKVAPSPAPTPSPAKSTLTPLPTKPPQLAPSRPVPQPLPTSTPPQPVSGHVPLPTQESEPEPPPQLIPKQPPPPVETPKPAPVPPPQPTIAPTPQLTPTPTPPPQPTMAPAPQLTPTPSIPTPTPLPQAPPPQMSQPPLGQTTFPTSGQELGAPAAQADPYPNRIDVNMLSSQKSGVTLTPVVDTSIEGGRVKLSS